MNLKLTIEASPSVLAAILANLPAGASVAAHSSGTPPMPILNGSDDDDSGPVNAAAPTVDSAGLPWDERIHAKTKTTKGDGTWKKGKGVDDATFAAVEAELRQRMGIVAGQPQAQPGAFPTPQPAPLAAPGAYPMPGAMPGAPAPIVSAMPGAMPAPNPQPMPQMQPTPQPQPQAQPVAGPQPGTVDFHGFMQHLSSKMQQTDANGAPLVHADYLAGITNEISAAFAPHGIAPLTAITDIATNPNMINFAIQLLQRDQRW